jgi:hypothetical protein
VKLSSGPGHGIPPLIGNLSLRWIEHGERGSDLACYSQDRHTSHYTEPTAHSHSHCRGVAAPMVRLDIVAAAVHLINEKPKRVKAPVGTYVGKYTLRQLYR